MRYLIRLEIHPFKWYLCPFTDKDNYGGEIKFLIEKKNAENAVGEIKLEEAN